MALVIYRFHLIYYFYQYFLFQKYKKDVMLLLLYNNMLLSVCIDRAILLLCYLLTTKHFLTVFFISWWCYQFKTMFHLKAVSIQFQKANTSSENIILKKAFDTLPKAFKLSLWHTLNKTSFVLNIQLNIPVQCKPPLWVSPGPLIHNWMEEAQII